MSTVDKRATTCLPCANGALIESQAAQIAALTAERDLWVGLYRRAINEANGLTNYVEDRPELRSAEKRLSAIEAAARASLNPTTTRSEP